MDADEMLSLVQPTAFHAYVGTIELAQPNGSKVEGIVLHIQHATGVFVQIMEADNAKRVGAQLAQMAEASLMKNALVVPTSKLVVPNGHPGA